MKKILPVSILAILILFGLGTHKADAASFGVSPPYVKNNTLIRNSVYEQKITLVRGNPDTDLQARIEWDVPGADDWISIDRGTEFIMPKGEQKVPITIRVNVPGDARFQTYDGNMRITTSSLADIEETSGSVRIALGARISVDLNVVDKKIYDFEVRRIKVQDLNQYRTWRWLTYPGRIIFTTTISNTGNVPVAPTKVVFDIYDKKGEELLETTENTNKLNKINPFEEGDVVAELPTFLEAGSYLAEYKIYLNEEVKQEGEINLSVLPQGTLLADTGYGFWGLTLFDKFTVVGPITFIIIALLFFYKEQLFTDKTAFGRSLRSAVKSAASKAKAKQEE